MDTSSGLSSNSSEGDLQQLLDQRKRKRMISNRESARRSRQRKQKHLDDLMAQVAQLRKENQQIHNGLNVTSQHYLTVEAENSILRAQAAELSHRLQSLTEIASFVSVGGGDYGLQEEPVADYDMDELFGLVNNTWNCLSGQPSGAAWNCLSQPIYMAAAASADASFMLI